MNQVDPDTQYLVPAYRLELRKTVNSVDMNPAPVPLQYGSNCVGLNSHTSVTAESMLAFCSEQQCSLKQAS